MAGAGELQLVDAESGSEEQHVVQHSARMPLAKYGKVLLFVTGLIVLAALASHGFRGPSPTAATLEGAVKLAAPTSATDFNARLSAATAGWPFFTDSTFLDQI